MATQLGRSGEYAENPVPVVSTKTNIGSFQSCLLKDTVQRAGRKIVAWLPRHRHDAALGRVLILPMTAAGSVEKPTIGLNSLDDFSDFQRAECDRQAPDVNDSTGDA